jgi:hypothetical protein
VPKFPKIHKGCFWRMQRWAAWIKNRVRYFKSNTAYDFELRNRFLSSVCSRA